MVDGGIHDQLSTQLRSTFSSIRYAHRRWSMPAIDSSRCRATIGATLRGIAPEDEGLGSRHPASQTSAARRATQFAPSSSPPCRRPLSTALLARRGDNSILIILRPCASARADSRESLFHITSVITRRTKINAFRTQKHRRRFFPPLPPPSI